MGVLVVLAESCAGVSVVGSQGPAMGDWHISKVYVSPMHFPLDRVLLLTGWWVFAVSRAASCRAELPALADRLAAAALVRASFRGLPGLCIPA